MPSPARPPVSPWAPMDQREAERAAKRDAVLRTAARFFNQRGYHSTSLDDVAAALHVTKPTLYHYFANKDEILYECTRRGLDEIATMARSTAGADGTAADRLRQMLTAYALIMMDDFGICVARTQDHLLSPESRKGFRALKRDIDQLVRQVIAEGVADGSLRVADVRIAAFTASVALNGLGTWFRPDGPVGADETARLTVDVLMHGMRPEHRKLSQTYEEGL